MARIPARSQSVRFDVPRAAPASAFALVLLLALSLTQPYSAAAPASPRVSSALVPLAGTVEFLNVSATGSFAFVPSQLSVTPRASVHLIVTQLADFNHTFTLSSVANATIPTSDTPGQLNAFFNAHAPLVNLSLGSLVGAKFYANFTGPAVGTYEFVCQVATHFQSGMHGTLTSGTSSGGTSSSSSALTTYIIIGVVVLVVVAVVAVLMMRRRPPANPTQPPTPPTPNP